MKNFHSFKKIFLKFGKLNIFKTIAGIAPTGSSFMEKKRTNRAAMPYISLVLLLKHGLC